MAKTSKADLLLIATLQDRASNGLKALDHQLQSVQRHGVLNIKSFGALDQAAGGFGAALQGDLGVLTRFAGGAGVLALATGAGKAAIELGNLGQQAEMGFRKLTAFMGSERLATEATDQMVAAVDGGIDRMAAMGQASMLMSMGLAKTGAEAANVARIATMMGSATRTVEDKVSDFAMLLANVSVRRLDQFGMSADQVRKRIDEMTAAGSRLSEEQKFVNAVLEIGAEKLKLLEDRGVKAALAQDRLTSAITNWKLVTGQKVAPFTAGIQASLAEMIETTTNPQAADILTSATKTRIEAERVLREEFANADQAQRANMEAYVEWARVAEAAALRNHLLAEGFTDLAVAVALAGTNIKTLTGSNIVGFQDAQIKLLQESAANWAQTMLQFSPEARAALMMREGSVLAYQNVSAGLKVGESFIEKQERELKEANERSASNYESRMQDAVSRVGGWISEAISGSKELFNALPGQGAGGIFDDPNGPFRDVRRALDVAKKGGASPWAAVLGMDQATAKQIAADFQRGIISPAVEALIDPAQMRAWIERQNLAERTQKAFAEKWGIVLQGGLEQAVSDKKMAAYSAGEKWGIVLQGGLEQAVSDRKVAAYSAGLSMAEAILGGFKSGIPIGPAAAGEVHAPGGGYAAGGWASGWSWVGEQGPELVNLPRGSRVFSHRESRGMMGVTNIVNRQGDTVILRDLATTALYVDSLRTKRLARMAEGF